MKKQNRLWTLFYTTFSISALTSGGYVIVSMMRKKFVEKLGWLSEEEMLDLTSIAQSSPGPVAINTSVLLGYKIAGLPGAFLTVFGTTLPPLVIMSFVAVFYDFFATNEYVRYFMRGMQSGVAALIVNVEIGLFTRMLKQKSWLTNILMLLSFIVAVFTDINVAYIAIVCALAGIIKVLVMKNKLKGENK